MPNRLKIKLFVVLGSIISLNVGAEVISEGNLALVINSTTQEYTNEEAVGTVSGNNLFHSFEQFNIATGETAVFSGSTNVTNIISRISSSSPSTIDGTLKSTIDGANLWILNPNGILFGESASLDITGSFYASTANTLNFVGGSQLNSGVFTGSDSFSTALPESFGFSVNDPSPIVINGSNLSVTAGNDLGLISGPLNIYNAKLQTDGGNMNILAINTAGVVPVTSNDIEIGIADINISNSDINVTGNSDQSISIVGGKIVIADSSITVSQQATVEIKGTDTIISNSSIEANAAVNITSDKLVIRDTKDQSLIEASLSVNKLNLLFDDTASSDFSSIIEMNSDIAISVNGELQNNSIPVEMPLANDNSTVSNSSSDENGELDPNKLNIFQTVTELEFSENNVKKSVSQESSNNCISNINNEVLSTRPIFFQPMPSEFNPGSLYSNVDLKQLNKNTSSNTTLGIFNKCS